MQNKFDTPEMLDLWKLRLNKREQEVFQAPTDNESVRRRTDQVRSNYRLRELGFGIDGSLWIIEEERPHINIIGSTQEGKSKFIEWLIRGDIERGVGLCLLDPTTGGKTVYDVLDYCCSKGIKKVCLIDPYHRFEFNKVPGINPFLYTADGFKSEKLKQASIHDLIDAVRVLFNLKDPAETPRIERYLPAVLNVLYDAQSPLRDVKYFTNRLYEAQRNELLTFADEDSRVDLEEAFRHQVAYVNYQSTVNRLHRFFKGTLGLIFTPDNGINFMKLVSEGWIILVNLDSGLGFDTLDSRLLGTLIINQIQTSIERLNKKGWYKPYYLYIDEASRYANRKLADTLSLKQKTGLRLTVGYQYTDQFEDKYVLNSILANCGITAMFNVRMAKDRNLISEQFYGGEISPKDASYANADLPKQYAVIKALKGKPGRYLIPDVIKPPITKEQRRQYILDIYQNNGWYYDADKLEEPLKYETPRQTTKDTRVARPRTQADSRAGRKAGVSNTGNQSSKWKAVSQNLPVSEEHAGEDGRAEGS